MSRLATPDTCATWGHTLVRVSALGRGGRRWPDRRAADRVEVVLRVEPYYGVHAETNPKGKRKPAIDASVGSLDGVLSVT
jgi:hypothetical protein